MSEQEQQEQVTVEKSEGPVQLPSDHPLVKTLAAQKEQIRELKDKASRLDEIEESQRTDLERAIARAEAAEKWKQEREARDAAAELAAQVAKDKGVPVSALRGSTKEELEAHADELLALIPERPKVATDASGGDRGEDIDGPKQITSVEELKTMTPEQINAARAAGQLDQLLGKN